MRAGTHEQTLRRRIQAAGSDLELLRDQMQVLATKWRGENIMHQKQTSAPDSTAVRVALWRALHVQIDPLPHVLEDEVGLRLAAPDDGWRARPDMDPVG